MFAKILIFTIILVMGVSTVGAQVNPYYDNRYGFSLKFPSDWKVEQLNSQIGEILYAESSLENDKDIFSENLTIQIIAPPTLNLEVVREKRIEVWGQIFIVDKRCL